MTGLLPKIFETVTNALRVGQAYRARNFGLIDIGWNKLGGPQLRVDIRGEQGQVALSQSVNIASLRVGTA